METGLGREKERKINRDKRMCDYCSKIALKDSFQTPNEYEKTVAYIKELVDIQRFVLIEGSCELGCHKNIDGHWIDDIIYHIIKCPKCGQTYTCVVNTYRGGGSFSKGSSSPF